MRQSVQGGRVSTRDRSLIALFAAALAVQDHVLHAHTSPTHTLYFAEATPGSSPRPSIW
ncbi:MAG TPA: hypothetical protein VM493_08730 [Vicinamibacterales bacterium]|jgi:hypothetical protein|nr:hypothetical protein [Vicinamibacterales bacterium]